MASIANPHLMSRLAARGKRVSGVLFGRYLLFTNVGISVSLSATGDILQQHYDILRGSQRGGWNAKRTRDMALSGLSVGILCHYWYLWLDRQMPGRTLSIVLKKMVVDQLVLSPVQISLFFVTIGVLEGSSVETVKKEIAEKGVQLFVAELFIWPVAQILNFAFLPTRFRILYDNTISLGFDVYTSYVKHGKPDQLEDDGKHGRVNTANGVKHEVARACSDECENGVLKVLPR